ncbi:F-BOX PROTEIN INTERACTION DOMAIN PROTEIN-RELATED [Salix purpurea]|uniref:F-BOX PROTEIN INTERACTION DOMAIN PROTEIN-RELATED n=1 Tax=Salix purpurea TaxID=77065 RepID=A0A9Q0ZAM9_SALPP|nr:F-BOX PROTEIN INTERACTION DOMAIN PROTEIN-RELATED [Salix purpurea]
MATCSDGKASESCSCAGFLLSNLPDDVLVEILCRVTDHKHLTRLKSVCKSWSNLITDACVPKISASSPPHGFIYIVKKARNGKPNNIDYFPCPMTPRVAPGPHEFVKSYSLLLPFQPTRNDFLDCCNGLLLFVEGCTLQYYVHTGRVCIYVDGTQYLYIYLKSRLICFDLNRGNSRAIEASASGRDLIPMALGALGPSRGRLCYSRSYRHYVLHLAPRGSLQER